MRTKNISKTLPVPTKEISHTCKMKRQYAYNRATILQELGLTEDEYNNQFFEAGCQLLEELYNRADKDMAVWYERFAKDENYLFWKWFKAEFKVLENDFVNVLIGGNIKLVSEDWNDFLNGIPYDQLLEKSLIQFTTRIPYVKL